MYLGLYYRESLPTLGNKTGVWIMYLGIYARESLLTLGTTQVSGYNIWDYVTGIHSLLWEQHRCLDNVFGRDFLSNSPDYIIQTENHFLH